MSREPQDWVPRREWQRVTSEQVELLDKWDERYNNFDRRAGAFLLTKPWELWSEEQKALYFDTMNGLDPDQIEAKWEELYAEEGDSDE
jgi:hypothetical protein